MGGRTVPGTRGIERIEPLLTGGPGAFWFSYGHMEGQGSLTCIM